MTRDELQILVMRELRKAGFEIGQPRVHRRAELPEPESGFVLELIIPMSWAGATHRALVVCRQQHAAVGPEVIVSAATRLRESAADAAIVFAPAFAADAPAVAQDAAVALLQIVDGRSVLGAGAAANHYPAWLPAHLVQVVDRDAGGQLRTRLLEAGRADMILEALRV